MNVARGFGAGLLALVMAGAATAVTGTTAQAAGTSGAAAAPAECPYPYVCIYKNDTRIGMFQDVTSGYQNLPSRPTGPNLTVVNTRNDDVVWLRYSAGSAYCLPVKQARTFGTGTTLTGIRISDSPTCT